jgi:hypothetical protein
MAFTATTRFGATQHHADDADIPAVVESLLRELEAEPFGQPSDRDEVAIAHRDEVAIAHRDWAVTVTAAGLMILNDRREPDGWLALQLYQWAVSREEATRILTLVARGEVEAGWLPRNQVSLLAPNPFRQS